MKKVSSLMAEQAVSLFTFALPAGLAITYETEEDAKQWEVLLLDMQKHLPKVIGVYRTATEKAIEDNLSELQSYPIWRESTTVYIRQFPHRTIKLFRVRG